MTVAELRDLLAAFPDHHEVMVGPAYATEVRAQSLIVRHRERHGGQAIDGAVVVVIS